MGRVQPCKISQSFPGFGLDMKYFAAPEIGVSCVGMATSCPSVCVLEKNVALTTTGASVISGQVTTGSPSCFVLL